MNGTLCGLMFKSCNYCSNYYHDTMRQIPPLKLLRSDRAFIGTSEELSVRSEQ